MANRTVRVTIEAAVAGAIANVRAFRGAVGDMGKELDVLGRKHSDSYNKIASTTGRLGFGLALAFGAVVKSTMDFDKQMSAVVAVSNDGAASLGALRTAAIAAGRDTAFTATQAAQAEEELAKAGLSTKDILGGGLTGALNLAAAGTIDLADAATIAAQAMVEFNLSGKDVGHIADVLTSGANASTSSVGDLGLSLGQVGGIAHQVGLSLEDTVGVLARFAQGGMNGEEAGTTLKQTLLQLISPSKEAADLMRSLGINIYDASGQFVGITGVANQLRKAMENLTPAQRNAALGTLFGARAVRGATILYQEGAKGIQEWIDKSNVSGQAATTASVKLDNLSGDLHKLLGSLQAVAIQSGGGASGGLRKLAQGAELSLNAFLGLPKPIQETAVVLLGVSAAGLLATSGLLKVRKAVVDTMDAMRSAGPLGTRFASGLSTVGKVAGGLALVAVGAGLAYEGVKALGDWMSHNTKPVARDIDVLTVSLRQFAATGQATGYMAQVYGTNLQKLAADMRAVAASQAFLATHSSFQYQVSGGKGGGAVYAQKQADLARASANQATTDVKALDNALAQVAAGSASQASIAFMKISQGLREQGLTTAQITAMFPEYTKAAAGAAAQNTGLAQGFADASAQGGILAAKMSDLITKGETFATVWKELNGAMLGSDQAMLAANQAIDNVTATLKRNKNAWQGNSTAALEDRIAVGQAAQQAAEAAQKKYEETGSVEAANAVYRTYIANLRDAMIRAGMNKAAVNALIAKYAQMPSDVYVNIHSNARDEADRIQNALNKLRAITGKVWTYRVVGNFGYIQTPNGRIPMNEKGGVTVAAADGLTTAPAGVYPPQPVGRFLFAESRTLGETLIPNYGIPAARGLALSDYAASHYGGRVFGADDMSALAAAVTDAARSAMVGQQALAQAIRTALAGVTVQLDGRAVGRIQGTHADLISRGG